MRSMSTAGAAPRGVIGAEETRSASGLTAKNHTLWASVTAIPTTIPAIASTRAGSTSFAA